MTTLTHSVAAPREPAAAEGLRTPAAYLPELETLRGVAILLVVLFHYHGILGAERSPDAPLGVRVIAGGNTGVTLFFVLSGFLLARPFISALRDGTSVSTLRFYRARALRILPAYLVIVAVAWVVTRAPALWKALVFIPLGMQAFPFALPWWSLCTEVQFYALLPWVMLLPGTRVGRWILAGLLVAWLALYAWCALGLEWSPAVRPLRNSFFGRGSGFIAGAMLAWFVSSTAYAGFRRSPLASRAVLAACTALLVALLGWYGGRTQEAALAALPLFHDLEAVLWAGIMLACLSGAAGWMPFPIRAALDGTAVISYSLYLVHVPIQFFMLYPAVQGAEADGHGWPLAVRIAASGIVAWATAWFGYRFIERPFLRRKATLRVGGERRP